MNLTKYQCPACTGPLKFSGKTGRLECEYCGSSFAVEEIDAKLKEELKFEPNTNQNDAQPQQSQSVWNNQNLRTYNCSTCGAELICEEISVSISCPYCGNPTILPASFTTKGVPEYIIPFRFEKKSAAEALKKYYEKKRFLPKIFSTQNHVEEIKGIYVPFWLYDGKVDAALTAEGTISHTERNEKYEVTTTEHYRVSRAGTISFEKVPADASAKMDDALMDSIEPFDFSDLKSFSTSYLPGFFAESYDVSIENCRDRARNRVENSAIRILYNDITGYDSVHIHSRNAETTFGKTSYAFFPVWLLTTKYKDKIYHFAMNGQTGKFTGNLPLDKKKYAAWFTGILLSGTVIVSAVIYLIVQLMERL